MTHPPIMYGGSFEEIANEMAQIKTEKQFEDIY